MSSMQLCKSILKNVGVFHRGNESKKEGHVADLRQKPLPGVFRAFRLGFRPSVTGGPPEVSRRWTHPRVSPSIQQTSWIRRVGVLRTSRTMMWIEGKKKGSPLRHSSTHDPVLCLRSCLNTNSSLSHWHWLIQELFVLFHCISRLYKPMHMYAAA
jgi:hypothetical protein